MINDAVTKGGGALRRSALYPYPTVQYIPLHLELLSRKEPIHIKPFLLLGQDISAHRSRLKQEYDWDLPALLPSGDHLPIIAGGVDLLEAKYRGFYVTFKGAYRSCLSLLQIPTKYFYKTRLIFEVKNEDGQKLLSRVYHLVA